MADTDRRPTLKAFSGLTIKDEAKGEVEAVVATLGVVDRDGDIIRPTALPKAAKVKVSSWGHDAMFGEPPAGKGTLARDGNELRFKGRLFLTTTHGRDTFEVLKELGEDTEWSFGFLITGWERPTEEEQKQGAFRIITKMEAFEVSPVMMGAGIGTHTVRVKSIQSDPQADGDGGVQHTVTVTIPDGADPATVADEVARAVLKELGGTGATRSAPAPEPEASAADASPGEPQTDAEIAQLAAEQKARDLVLAQQQATEAERAVDDAARAADTAQVAADRKAQEIATKQAAESATAANLHAQFQNTVHVHHTSPEVEFARFQRTMRRLG